MDRYSQYLNKLIQHTKPCAQSPLSEKRHKKCIIEALAKGGTVVLILSDSYLVGPVDGDKIS